MSKGEIRRETLGARRSLSSVELRLLSGMVEDLVTSLPEYAGARVVASYVAKPDEVQTDGIIGAAIASGKKVIVPRSDARSLALTFHELDSLGSLVVGSFGVMEPRPGLKQVPLSDAQLVLVPVVAWDEAGQRLGYGRGFFDRALLQRGSAVAAGLALELQRRSTLPRTGSDVPLDLLITEKRVLRFGGRANG